MICPYCNKDYSFVINSRQSTLGNYRMRRYECGDCGMRYTTREEVVPTGSRRHRSDTTWKLRFQEESK